MAAASSRLAPERRASRTADLARGHVRPRARTWSRDALRSLRCWWCSPAVVVRELVARVLAPGDRGSVECAEPDDQESDDDEDAHGSAPFLLTLSDVLIGYYVNCILLRVTCQ